MFRTKSNLGILLASSLDLLHKSLATRPRNASEIFYHFLPWKDLCQIRPIKPNWYERDLVIPTPESSSVSVRSALSVLRLIEWDRSLVRLRCSPGGKHCFTFLFPRLIHLIGTRVCISQLRPRHWRSAPWWTPPSPSRGTWPRCRAASGSRLGTRAQWLRLSRLQLCSC